MVSSVGRRLPAHCTAVGKVLLAELAPAELDLRYRRRKLTAMTPRSITTLAALKKETARIREAELATEFCESNEAVACVAAPVRDHQGETVAAMSISVPITRWNAAQINRTRRDRTRRRPPTVRPARLCDQRNLRPPNTSTTSDESVEDATAGPETASE
ncbi:IclR family transcriptional regulator [Fodinicola feengrottensis]|uniref:IclR family transcriptional regulator n=1 Tax=Fodinicola feengrottensis TaxID=435914 RepID=UPI0036F1CEA8